MVWLAAAGSDFTPPALGGQVAARLGLSRGKVSVTPLALDGVA
jgi:hypothetical protein